MLSLTRYLPNVDQVLALSTRQLGGYILEASNADPVNPRNHPKNIRNAIVDTWYRGQHSEKAVFHILGALDLLMRDGYIAKDYADTVNSEWFVLTDKGRAVKEHSQIFEPSTLPESMSPLVFISCGQRGPERDLGLAVAQLIETHTGCEAYFAQNQTSVDGLSNNIFRALGRCTGLVLIMHKRGTFTRGAESLDKGSVWIEQEVAIAAFLQHFGKRNIAVAAYIQEGIAREGVRQLIQLNELSFTTDAEILADLERRIADGRFKPSTVASDGNSIDVTTASDSVSLPRMQLKLDVRTSPTGWVGFDGTIWNAGASAANKISAAIVGYISNSPDPTPFVRVGAMVPGESPREIQLRYDTLPMRQSTSSMEAILVEYMSDEGQRFEQTGRLVASKSNGTYDYAFDGLGPAKPIDTFRLPAYGLENR